MTNNNPYGSGPLNPEGEGFGQNGQPVQYGQPAQYGQQGQPQNPQAQDFGGQQYGQPAQQYGQPGQPVQNGQWQQNGNEGNAGNGAATFANNLKARPFNQLVAGVGAIAALLFLLFYSLAWRTVSMSFFGISLNGKVNGWGSSKFEGLGELAAKESSDLDGVQLALALIAFALLVGAVVLFFLGKEKVIAAALGLGSGVVGIILLILASMTVKTDEIKDIEEYGATIDLGYGVGFFLALLLHVAVIGGVVWLFLKHRPFLLEGSKFNLGLGAKAQPQQQFAGQQYGQQQFGPQDNAVQGNASQGYGDQQFGQQNLQAAQGFGAGAGAQQYGQQSFGQQDPAQQNFGGRSFGDESFGQQSAQPQGEQFGTAHRVSQDEVGVENDATSTTNNDSFGTQSYGSHSSEARDAREAAENNPTDENPYRQ